MSNKRAITLRAAAYAGAFAALLGASTAASSTAVAQELSDRSVNVLMTYAWSILPSKFTAPTGKVIIVDKSKRDENMVPVDAARRIIKVARLSAHAQICNLPEAQAANFQTMMRAESVENKWTDQQMLYISQLHLFTVMWLTGNVKLVDRNGDKEVQLNESSSELQERTCTEEERQEILRLIKENVCKADPKHIIGCTS
ncbi:MAG: hypothetical protein GC150_04435 [Rhizobiales bacterium]|nr:hypothetical protein [Hyphomicrobiales bacterium]